MPGTTSTALPSFSHDQHHKTDAAKRKGGYFLRQVILLLQQQQQQQLLLLLLLELDSRRISTMTSIMSVESDPRRADVSTGDTYVGGWSRRVREGVSLSCCTAGLGCVNTLLFELLYCAVAQSPPLGPIRRQSFQFCIVNIAGFQVHTKLVFVPFCWSPGCRLALGSWP